MTPIKLLPFIVALPTLLFASHTCESNAPYCTENATVDYVQTDKNGGLMACFDVNVSYLHYCSHGPKCVSADQSDPGLKGMLSVLSTAKSTGAKVDFYVSDTQCIYPTDTTSTGWYRLSSVVLDQ